jgi:hypothetical protein
MRIDPTLIGTVQDVSGTSVSVSLQSASATGLSFVNGESYRIGQVGSFVRIPLGYTSLFGIVSQVGAGAAPRTRRGGTNGFASSLLGSAVVPDVLNEAFHNTQQSMTPCTSSRNAICEKFTDPAILRISCRWDRLRVRKPSQR